MPNYRRRFDQGATYFFTVVTQDRRPIFKSANARRLLRKAFVSTLRVRPFEFWATVLLPEHMHCIWTLPENDFDFSTRWSILKRTFSQAWRSVNGSMTTLSTSRKSHRELVVWQRRFWEHQICSERELYAYRDYVHLNPVKHGFVSDPHD